MTERELNVEPLAPFVEMYETEKRYIHLRGGRSSGKSYAIGEYMVAKSFETNFKGLILRQVLSTTDESIKAQVVAAIETMDLSHAFETTARTIKNLQTGNVISIMGFKTSNSAYSAKLKSIVDYTHVVIEEAVEVPEEDFDRLDESIRLADVELKIIMVYNTPHVRHPMFKRWFNPDGTPKQDNDSCHIMTDYRDVPRKYINESTYKLIERTKNDQPEKYKHVWLGHWALESEKQIYRGWQSLDTFPDHVPFIYVLDWGYNDPTAIIKIGTEGEKMYIQELLYAKNLINADIVTFLKTLEPRPTICDSSEPRSIAELRRPPNKIQAMPAIKGPDSIRNGISDVQEMQVFICGESPNVWEEQSLYEWNDKKSGVPIDKYNHSMDCVRYGYTYLRPRKRKGSRYATS